MVGGGCGHRPQFSREVWGSSEFFFVILSLVRVVYIRSVNYWGSSIRVTAKTCMTLV